MQIGSRCEVRLQRTIVVSKYVLDKETQALRVKGVEEKVIESPMVLATVVGRKIWDKKYAEWIVVFDGGRLCERYVTNQEVTEIK